MPLSPSPARAPASERDRRRADREVRRVLSASRSIAIWVFFIVSSHVSGFALLAGNGPLALVAGALAFGSYVALCARAEPLPDRGPKGEVATMPDPAFEQLVHDVEREAELLASGVTAASRADEAADAFAQLVRAALDDLPQFLRSELEGNVAVVISDDGDLHGAYGMYVGGTVARRSWCDRILIYRDTLMRDYGDDPYALRRMITMVVRHEMAHHLGAGERHVAELGLSDKRRSRPRTPCAARIAPRPRAEDAVAEPRRPAASCRPLSRTTRAAARPAAHGRRARPAPSPGAPPRRRAARRVRSRARSGGPRGPPRRLRRAAPSSGAACR